MGQKETLLVTGDVVDPVDYVKIWNSKEMERAVLIVRKKKL